MTFMEVSMLENISLHLYMFFLLFLYLFPSIILETKWYKIEMLIAVLPIQTTIVIKKWKICAGPSWSITDVQ